jgi:hypothetical protein
LLRGLVENFAGGDRVSARLAWIWHLKDAGHKMRDAVCAVSLLPNLARLKLRASWSKD